MSWQNIKYILYAMLAVWVIAKLFFNDNSDSASSQTQYEEVVLPSQGLATIVEEVDSALYKIADEQVLEDTAASLIIANYLDETSDTFTLAEARLIQQGGNYNGRGGSVVSAASYGLFGYMLGRNMGAFRPRASAYKDPSTHQRVTNKAGNTMRQTATRKTRVRPGGKSGFGSGKSTRSYGG